MTFTETIRSALKDFKSLMNVIYFSAWKVIGYFLLLSFILSVPLSYQISRAFHHVKDDFVKITKEVPNFTIENNQLTVDNKEKGGIYLTDNFIVTLDENGKRTAENIRSDASTTAFSIGFLPHQMVIALPKIGISDFIPQDSFSFPYEDLIADSFTKENFESLPEMIPNTILIPVFLLSFLASALNLLIILAIVAIPAMFLGRFIRIPFRFGIVFKIVVFASTWGVLFSAVLQAIGIPFDSIFAILIPTIWVYYRMLKDLLNMTTPEITEEDRKKLPPL